MAPKIIVHFSLTGRFDPDEVTSILEMMPSKIWRYGETIQSTLLTYKHDGWRVSTNRIRTFDLNKEILIILNRISPFSSIIRNICNTMNIEAEIACSVDLDGDEFPEIHLSRKAIKIASEINAEIDIDFF